jgi:hypothetical protein
VPQVVRPLAVDLFTGLHGWASGLIGAGWRVVGFDLEDMSAVVGEPKPDDFALVIQNVFTLHGSQFRGAELIVASPPCTEFSWMAMPWSRGKQAARALRGEDEFPEGYRGSRTIEGLSALFNACFRIQREASEAAGRHIPLVVENVRGAQPWVGRARWNFGSYYLWGDVPALMPPVATIKNGHIGGGSWFAIGSPGQTAVNGNPDGRKLPGFRFDGSGRSFQTASVGEHVKVPSDEGRKHHGDWFRDPDCPTRQGGQIKAPAGTRWFNDGPRTPESLASSSSRSPRRKAASAKIAKIPFTLAYHVGRTWLP